MVASQFVDTAISSIKFLYKLQHTGLCIEVVSQIKLPYSCTVVSTGLQKLFLVPKVWQKTRNLPTGLVTGLLHICRQKPTNRIQPESERL